MRVISVPARIGWIGAVLSLAAPLGAWQSVLVSAQPWWKISRVLVGGWALVAWLAIVPGIWAIFRARKWALDYLRTVAILWGVLSLWLGIRQGSTGLGFFTVLLGAYFTFALIWLEMELGRSFYDPKVRWFQGLPRPLGGVSASVQLENSVVPCRVGRLDEDGAFLFSGSGSALPGLRGRAALDVAFEYRDRSIRCQATPVTGLDQDVGFGVQFVGLSADDRKGLGDFIEMLRGEGHV